MDPLPYPGEISPYTQLYLTPVIPVALRITGAAGHMSGVVSSGEVRKLSCRESGAVVGDDSLRDSIACEFGLQLVLYMGCGS